MRARSTTAGSTTTGRTRARRTAPLAVALGLTGVLALGVAVPAAAQAVPDPLPTVRPDPVLPGPVLPWPPSPPLAWEVELTGAWRSPTWSQGAGQITAVVQLDCGDALGVRPPRYYVQLVPEDGRAGAAVMPPSVACGVAHTFTWDEKAGRYHLMLAKASTDRGTLRGKVAVRTP